MDRKEDYQKEFWKERAKDWVRKLLFIGGFDDLWDYYFLDPIFVTKDNERCVQRCDQEMRV